MVVTAVPDRPDKSWKLLVSFVIVVTVGIIGDFRIINNACSYQWYPFSVMTNVLTFRPISTFLSQYFNLEEKKLDSKHFALRIKRYFDPLIFGYTHLISSNDCYVSVLETKDDRIHYIQNYFLKVV